ncbi:hypothetical protein B0J17DRAFT_703964 [Rhizoctonia solani]|nr:hypothetical protein B0J17DRAFT_703964 [Rhizoctonia solani]
MDMYAHSHMVQVRPEYKYMGEKHILAITAHSDITILAFAAYKKEFEAAIASTRKHESAIIHRVANGENPTVGWVTQGFQKAVIPLMRFSKYQFDNGSGLMNGFITRLTELLREMARRIKLALDPRVKRTRWSAMQKRNGLHSR